VSDGRPIYLDHNATTPVLPEVVEAMLPYFGERFGNPSSGHPYGKEARSAVDAARGEVAGLLGCEADEVVFCSGGTEANNLAILGAAAMRPYRHHVVTTAIEHPATLRCVEKLERERARVTRLGVDGVGRVAADAARDVVDDETLLVTMMLANNETGAVQPVRAFADAARARGALVHTDAAQAAGKIPVSVRDLDVDLLTIAGHKLYAPKGVGALYVRRGSLLSPVALGASHERGLRPGTENVPGIVGLGRACAIAARDVIAEGHRLRGLAKRLFTALATEIPDLGLNGPPLDDEARLPNTVSVRFPRTTGSAILAAAPEIAATTGAACHEGQESASKVILAMGIPEAEAIGTVRLSLGRRTTESDVDAAARALARAFRSVTGG
jgi:cysteine desulfurase